MDNTSETSRKKKSTELSEAYAPRVEFLFRALMALFVSIYIAVLPEGTVPRSPINAVLPLNRSIGIALCMGYFLFHVFLIRKMTGRGYIHHLVIQGTWLDIIIAHLAWIGGPYEPSPLFLLVLVGAIGNGLQHGLRYFRPIFFLVLILSPLAFVLRLLWFGFSSASLIMLAFSWCLLCYTYLLLRRIETYKKEADERADESAEMAGRLKQEIKEHKRAEEELRESEERFREMFDNVNDAVYMNEITPEGEPGKFLEANKTACNMLGFSRQELLKMGIQDIDSKEKAADIPGAMERLRKDGHTTFEAVHKAKDGTRIPVEISSHVFTFRGRKRILSIARDVSERKIAEEERRKMDTLLRQAQRMEAIGTLAGGIAHDFNNLLMGIQGNISLAILKMDPLNPCYGKLKNIEEYVQNGAELTRQLLGFARGGKYKVRPTDLNRVVRRSSEMFARTKKEIVIHASYQEDIWSAEVDRGQIDQVMLNLYVNAWQAMPAGGELYLRTENISLPEEKAALLDLKAGGYVRIMVKDTGQGIDEEMREKIFDPFFTTKKMGRGTGLGLASAYGIIRNHGGIIDVKGRKGEGTTFYLYLPASGKRVPEEKKDTEQTMKGSETVLLVDDEDMILQIGEEMLENLGYRVLTAKGGKEAIELYSKNMGEISLVVLDVIMPEMNGRETFRELRKLNPQVKVLLASGYSINGKAAEIINEGCNGFIQKPFSLKELSQRTREIIDGGE